MNPDFSATATDGFNPAMNFTNNSFEMANNTTMEASFASTFRNRNAAMTTEELRKARESRAAEALRMKDEQLKILSEQNANLLKTLDKVFLIFFFF